MPYAVTAQLKLYGLPGAVVDAVEAAIPGSVAGALEASSRVVDSYLAKKHKIPLVTYGIEVTLATCRLAAYDLLVAYGFNPEGADEQVRARRDDAIQWLRDVSNGRAEITTEDETPETSEGSPILVSDPVRDW